LNLLTQLFPARKEIREMKEWFEAELQTKTQAHDNSREATGH